MPHDIEPGRAQYAQIADVLQGYIEAGRYRVGSALPAEDALATRYRVSRVTVNKAIQLLRSRGYVEVRRGVGVFVVTTAPPVPVMLTPDEARVIIERLGDADDVAALRAKLRDALGRPETPNAPPG